LGVAPDAPPEQASVEWARLRHLLADAGHGVVAKAHDVPTLVVAVKCR
jgi:hypothetical protein